MRYSGLMVAVREMSLGTLVDLVNGWGTTPRRAAGEEDWPYPEVDALDIAARARVTRRSLISVADALHPVFAATEPALRVRRVDKLLQQTAVRPQLTLAAPPRGSEGLARADRTALQELPVVAGWTVERPGDALLAAAAVALRSHLAEHGPERLGTCTGRRCADVYVDSSPTGHRRFCSVTCQNRARVAAFRAKARRG